MTTAADLYGKSLAFPPRVGANGQDVYKRQVHRRAHPPHL